MSPPITLHSGVDSFVVASVVCRLFFSSFIPSQIPKDERTKTQIAINPRVLFIASQLVDFHVPYIKKAKNELI